MIGPLSASGGSVLHDDPVTCDPAERAYRALAEMLIDAAERMRTLPASGEGKVEDAA